jgi:hypothetical protein
MTIEKIKEKYKYATKITCCYQNGLESRRRKIYTPVLSTIRMLHDYEEIVCDDDDRDTAFIGLWHHSRGFAEIIEEKIPQKFIDNSNSASNTFLDKQLSQLKIK